MLHVLNSLAFDYAFEYGLYIVFYKKNTTYAQHVIVQFAMALLFHDKYTNPVKIAMALFLLKHDNENDNVRVLIIHVMFLYK